MVLVIELTSGNHISDRRIEPVEQVVLLADDAEVIPAHAIVQSQTIGPAEAVLHVEAVVIFERMPRTVSLRYFAAIRVTCQETGKVRESQFAAKVLS